jgi:hypothetical protein
MYRWVHLCLGVGVATMGNIVFTSSAPFSSSSSGSHPWTSQGRNGHFCPRHRKRGEGARGGSTRLQHKNNTKPKQNNTSSRNKADPYTWCTPHGASRLGVILLSSLRPSYSFKYHYYKLQCYLGGGGGTSHATGYHHQPWPVLSFEAFLGDDDVPSVWDSGSLGLGASEL